MATMMGDQELVLEIVNLTKEHWEATGRPLLLSQLGLALNRRGIAFQQVLGGRKLLPFIRQEVGDKIQLLPHPTNKAVAGLTPPGAEVGDSNPFGSARVADHSPTTELRRFSPTVWAAFSVPLASGTKRYISLAPRIEFYDTAQNAPDGTGVFEIVASSIVPRPPFATAEQLDKRRQLIEQNIERWARDAGIELARLTSQLAHRIPNPASVVVVPELNLLDALMESLSETDLRRISIPLDVVRRLRDRKVKG